MRLHLVVSKVGGLISIVFAVLTIGVHAQTKDWSQTGAAAAWSTGTWSPAGAPSGTDSARFRTVQLSCNATGTTNVCAELRINADAPAAWVNSISIPSGATLTCNGSGGSALNWPTGGTASLSNAGTLELRGSASIAQSANFTNTGTVRFTALAATSTWAGPNVANWGNVQVDSSGGTLTLASNVTCNNLTVTAGTTLVIPTGTTLTVHGVLAMSGASCSVNVTGGTLILNSTPVIGNAAGGQLNISAGAVNLNAPFQGAGQGTISQSGGLFTCSADVDLSVLAGNYGAFGGGTLRLVGTGSGQNLTVGGAGGADVFYNLDLAGSAPVTVAAGATSLRVDNLLSLNTQDLSLGVSTGLLDINGSLTIASNRTLNLGTVSSADIEGLVTFAANAVLNANNRTITFGGNLDASAGGTITNPGQITFDRGTGLGVQTVSISPAFGSLGAVVVNRTSGSAADIVRVTGTGTFAATNLTVTRGTLLLETGASFGTTSVAANQALAGSAGTMSFTGGITNNGTMRFTGGAVLNAGSATSFTNNGVLDRMTAGAATTLPANFSNGASGVVLTGGLVKVKTISHTLNPDLTTYTVTVTIDGYQGHGYTLQRTTALGSVNFGNITSSQTGTGTSTGATLTFTDPSAPAGRGFYRVVVSP